MIDLKLDKIVGPRKDNPYEFIKAPIKKSTKFPSPVRSMKDVANITRDGKKK